MDETLGVVRTIGVVSIDEVEAIKVLLELLKNPRVELELEMTGVVSGMLTELEVVSIA